MATADLPRDYPEPDDDAAIFADMAAPEGVAEAEATPAYRPCPPGTHELIVNGFFGGIEERSCNGYVDGRPVSWECQQVCVELGLASDPTATVLHWLMLPPTDKAERAAYWSATAKPDDAANRAGRTAREFVQFINAIGYQWKQGETFPPAAWPPTRWKGRRLQGDVVEHFNGKRNKSGQLLSQIALFGLRASGSAQPANGHGNSLGARSDPRPAPAPAVVLSADDV